MKFVPTAIPEVVRVEPDVHRDSRGFFVETWREARWTEGGVPGPFVQDNHSRSRAGTVRGLHAQRLRPQGKLVRVVHGEIWDVAVDVRRGSPTFGRWVAEHLSAENFVQLWIPPGFAHGFAVLSDEAEFVYKCTDYYDATDELRIAWNDPALAIPWPVAEPLLSDADRGAKTLAEQDELLPRWSSA
ncbi:MAG: dTDP-4-dehydrorhamnose 3,5-epimerase [Myxococcota bacterium]